MTNAAFVSFVQVPAGAHVLEVGSGLGILCGEVAASAPSVRVVGLERSLAQLTAATGGPGVVFTRGDAHRLPFRARTFDLVYTRYLLEHIGDPATVLAEMCRVLRRGGRIAVQENDISLQRTDPPCPNFEAVWSQFAILQQRLGGDALIGRRLFGLFKRAGLVDIELSVQPEIHWSGSPGFAGWIANLIGNIESGRAALLEAKLTGAATVDYAVAELQALLARDDASLTFVWNRAAGRIS